jgi:hypothetical protein
LLIVFTSLLIVIKEIEKANGRIRTDNHWFTKPEHNTPKSTGSQALTKTGGSDLASYLALIVQEHPDLSTPIEAWPKLSVDLQRAIV